MAADYDSAMRHALTLAQKGWGGCRPNPMVGAVLVSDAEEILSEGFHATYGGPHAEVVALENALKTCDAAMIHNATLVVTLEPCNHTGKTAPCVEAILASGVKRVVFGSQDPNPRVAGGGAEALRLAGVEVICGVCEADCDALNPIFLTAMRSSRPFWALKLASTLDGKIATRSGESQWITGSGSRSWVHRQRAGFDAILSTAQTVLQDNARLTVRLDDGLPVGFRPPVRVILDRTLKLAHRAADLAALQSPLEAPVWIFCSPLALAQHPERAQGLIGLGALIFPVNTGLEGLSLDEISQQLWQEGLTSVWVEAGGRLANSLIQGHRVDVVHWLLSPRVMGDNAAISVISGGCLPKLADTCGFSVQTVEMIPPDVLLSLKNLSGKLP